MAKIREKNASFDRVKELLDYNPSSGEFRWRVARGSRASGSVAGCVTSTGYRYIMIDGQFYRANRIAFLLMTGSWPRGEVDHRNRLRGDDRWGNLRDATITQNKRNGSVRKDNRSGCRGVFFSEARGKWIAAIYRNGLPIRLGEFDEIEHAAAARRIGAAGLYGEFAA